MSYHVRDFPVSTFPRLTHFGYCSAETGRSVGPHSHFGYELLYVESGDAPIKMEPGSDPVELHTHDCVLISPGHEHAYEVPACGASYYWLGVQTAPDVVTSTSSQIPPRSLIQRAPHDVHVIGPDQSYADLRALATSVTTGPMMLLRRVPMIGGVFRDIEQELDNTQSTNAFLLYAKLIELFAWFQKRSQERIHDGASELVRHVMTHVLERLSDRHSVDSLAEYAGISPRQLQRLFRSQLGCSPSEFVETERINQASRQLVSGLRPSDIAARVGFRSHEQFSRRFKTRMGITPSDYRRTAVLSQ